MTELNDWNAKIIEEFRANEGRVGGQFKGAPVLLLHTTGVKTGIERINPVMYLEENGHLYVFASKAGHDSDPDWFRNLKANSKVVVEIGTRSVEGLAQVVNEPLRSKIYDKQASIYKGFRDYQDKTSRIIPVVELVLDE